MALPPARQAGNNDQCDQSETRVFKDPGRVLVAVFMIVLVIGCFSLCFQCFVIFLGSLKAMRFAVLYYLHSAITHLYDGLCGVAWVQFDSAAS